LNGGAEVLPAEVAEEVIVVKVELRLGSVEVIRMSRGKGRTKPRVHHQPITK
jgi:hypothetical protein